MNTIIHFLTRSLFVLCMIVGIMQAAVIETNEHVFVDIDGIHQEEFTEQQMQTESATQNQLEITFEEDDILFSHPYAIQTIYNISWSRLSLHRQKIELLDGSMWIVSWWHSCSIDPWFKGDNIIITPNKDWFRSSLFKFTNLRTCQSIPVHITQYSPLANGQLTRYIFLLNDDTSQILVRDFDFAKTLWTVAPYDTSTMLNWHQDDPIFVGVNPNNSDYPNILINIKRLNYVDVVEEKISQ